MARSVVGMVTSISTSTGNEPGVLDITVQYFAPTTPGCPSSGIVVAKCDITQDDEQLTAAIRQAVADAVNASAIVASPGIVATDVVGCNV